MPCMSVNQRIVVIIKIVSFGKDRVHDFPLFISLDEYHTRLGQTQHVLPHPPVIQIPETSMNPARHFVGSISQAFCWFL